MKATQLAKRYYRTLGLSCDASDEEIREAYYRLAFTHHPDRNPGDAYAAARFKGIQIAYEWLSQRRASRSPAGQFPFLTPERADAGLGWQWLAALAGLGTLAVTLMTLLPATPRMGAAAKTEFPRSQQLSGSGHFATKLHQPVKVSSEEFTTARGSLTTKNTAGGPDWLAESSVGNLLESVVRSSHNSFASTLDAACKEFLSRENLTETWHTGLSWRVTAEYGFPQDPLPITQTVSESSTRRTPKEKDRQFMIEDGMMRFGSLDPEPALLGEAIPGWPALPPSLDVDSLEVVPAQQPDEQHGSTPPSLPGFTFTSLQPTARPLETRNDSPSKWWNGAPHSLFLPKPQPMGHALPQGYESRNDGDALQPPRRNRHTLTPDAVSSTAFPNYRDRSNLPLLNPSELSSSAASNDAWRSSPLLPGQLGSNSSRQAEKLLRPWRLHETQQGQQSTDRPQPTATVDVSPWGANSGHKSSKSGTAAGNDWDSWGSFTPQRLRGIDFSFRERQSALPNLDWDSQAASAASSNHPSLPARSELQIEKNYFSPTVSKAGSWRGPYRDLPAIPSH